MKNRILLIWLFFCVVLVAQAQVPTAFTYQAVARDASGNLTANKTIGLRLSVLDGATPVYTETHVTQTNAYGMFSVNVGTGAAVTGTFAGIGWTAGNPKSLKTEIDFNGGTTYTDMGTTPFATVPYALVANSVSNMTLSKLSDVSTTAPTNNQVLQWNGSQWTPATLPTSTIHTSNALAGSGTVASPLTIAPQGATSGQVLQWNGSQWSPATLTTGGAGDNWGTQFAFTNVTLSGNGTNALPLGLAQQGALNGETLIWNGSLWTPGRPSISTDGTFTGNGTPSLPLKLGQQGAAVGDVLRWNGSNWLPGQGITLPYNQSLSRDGTVFAVTNTSTTSLANAIAGVNMSGSSVGSGIQGYHNGGGTGVLGMSNTGTAIYGEAISSAGFAGRFVGNVSVLGGTLTVGGAQVRKSSEVYLFDQTTNVAIQDATLTPVPGLNAMAFSVEASASATTPAKVRLTVNIPVLSTTSAASAGEAFQIQLVIKQGATVVKQLVMIDYIRTNSARTLSYTMHHKITTPGSYTAVVQFQKADATSLKDINVSGGQVQIDVAH